MDEVIMGLVTLIGLGIAVKVCRLIREIILTILYVLGLAVALRFAFKWIVTPMLKGLLWLGKHAWSGFIDLCHLIDRHFKYRNEIQVIEPDRINRIHHTF